MADNVNVFYQVALYGLNQAFKKPIEENAATIDNLDNNARTIIQNSITEAYKDQDKFKVYHVAKVSAKSYERLEAAILANTFKFDFLIEPSFSDWSIKGRRIKDNHFELIFSKFEIRLVKNPDEAQVAATPLIREPYYFQFLAEFKEEHEIPIVLLSFHAFRPNPYATYEFDQEINYFHQWVNNFGITLNKLDYKEVFDSLNEEHFEKIGFKGEDLRSESDLVKAVFKLKHNNKVEHSKKMHETIDKLMGTEISEMIMEGIQNIHLAHKSLLSKEIEKDLRVFLDSIQFSRKFFSTIQKGCDHGIGYVKHTPAGAKDFYEYNLEYTKTGEGLIRSRNEKWSSFEPLYNEIVKNLRGA